MKSGLLITLEYPPQIGGVANYYQSIVSASPEGSIVVLDNSQHGLLSQRRFVWPKWLTAIASIRKVTEHHKSACILVGQILPLGTVAYLYKKLFRIPYIVMTHAMDITVATGVSGKKRHRMMIQRILGSASAVTTVSQFTSQKLQELGVPHDKIVVITPCPSITPARFSVREEDILALNAQHHLASDAPVFLCAGRAVERKGFDVALIAFAELLKEHPEARMVYVGDGPDSPRLHDIVKQYNMSEQVIFTGRVSNAELSQWYARAQCVVMPTRELPNNDVEGFGIVYLEANSFGKPVIAGDAGGTRDAVVDGKTGYIVDPCDIGMLTEAMTRIVTNPEEARKMGEYSKERVLRDFRWEDRAQKLQQTINDYA